MRDFYNGFLEYIKFILYGIIQGLTEFIPVSSTAHLKVISNLIGIEDPGQSLSAIIQIGSVFAIFWYFKKDIFTFKNRTSKINFNSFFKSKLTKSIFIGTIPIIFLGGFIKLFIPNFFNTVFRSNLSIAIMSFVMAFFMYLADIRETKFINIKNHTFLNSLLIGFSQAFAIIPGVSRSGITISTALLSGWERRDAAKFSFLLGIPAISLAAIVEFMFSINRIFIYNLFPLIFGLITTFLSSLLAIDFLLKHLSKRGMKLFIYYRIIFALFILFNLREL